MSTPVQMVIFRLDWMGRERVDFNKSLGAQIVQVSREEGGFPGSIENAQSFARERDDVFLPGQFSNLAIMVKGLPGPDAVVVTVLSDCNKKHLTTDLMKEEPMKPRYLLCDVEFTGYTPIHRLCRSCEGQRENTGTAVHPSAFPG